MRIHISNLQILFIIRYIFDFHLEKAAQEKLNLLFFFC